MATYLGGREVLYIDSWPEPSSSAKMEKNTSPNIQQDPSPPPIDYCTAVRDRAMRNGYWKCHSVLPPFSRLCFRLGFLLRNRVRGVLSFCVGSCISSCQAICFATTWPTISRNREQHAPPMAVPSRENNRPAYFDDWIFDILAGLVVRNKTILLTRGIWWWSKSTGQKNQFLFDGSLQLDVYSLPNRWNKLKKVSRIK